jgi:hypothetical protein
LSVHGVNDAVQTEIHTTESTVPEQRVFEVELANKELKHHKSTCTDQIPSELIKAGSLTIHCEIHKHILSLCNKEELSAEWKKLIILLICTKCDKTDCSNYSGTSVLPTAYKILSNILLLKLTPYAEEIIGDHQCGF